MSGTTDANFPAPRWTPDARLTLRNTFAEALNDTADAWGLQPGRLDAVGFVYNRLGGLRATRGSTMSSRSVEWLKAWLAKQVEKRVVEIFADVFPGARTYGDSVEVATSDGKFSTAIAAGTVTPVDIAGEIGEVLLGEKPGRTSPDEITIFDSAGLAVQDVICALHVYEKAVEQKVGIYVDLGLAETPY